MLAPTRHCPALPQPDHWQSQHPLACIQPTEWVGCSMHQARSPYSLTVASENHIAPQAVRMSTGLHQCPPAAPPTCRVTFASAMHKEGTPSALLRAGGPMSTAMGPISATCAQWQASTGRKVGPAASCQERDGGQDGGLQRAGRLQCMNVCEHARVVWVCLLHVCSHKASSHTA